MEADEDVSDMVAVYLPGDESAVSLNKDDAVDRLKTHQHCITIVQLKMRHSNRQHLEHGCWYRATDLT